MVTRASGSSCDQIWSGDTLDPSSCSALLLFLTPIAMSFRLHDAVTPAGSTVAITRRRGPQRSEDSGRRPAEPALDGLEPLSTVDAVDRWCVQVWPVMGEQLAKCGEAVEGGGSDEFGKGVAC